MPLDRFLHPRLGHSEKVCGLSDLQFRVWVQYQLTADDFGVMRATAITVQAANDALAKRSAKTVQAALDHLVTVGLALSFEHQGYRYICQSDWQDFQRVGYPRLTTNPKPPADVLRTFSARTLEYLAKHPGGLAKDSPNIPETLAESLPSSRARETLTAKANGKCYGERPAPPSGPAPLGARSEHRAHALCGRACLPAFLFREFVQLAGGAEDAARAAVESWAFGLIQAIGDDGPRAAEPIGDPLKWWRLQWEAAHPTKKPSDPAEPTRAELDAIHKAEGERRARLKAFREGRR